MNYWNWFRTLAFLAAAFGGLHTYAQPSAQGVEVEVATVKRNPGCDSRVGMGIYSPDRWGMNCRPLRWYIEKAYASWDGPRRRLPPLEVLGGPRWVDTEMYDILIKTDRAAPYWQKSTSMLQSLLEERFELRVRTESKDAPVYLLTVDKPDPRLKRSPEGSCIPVDLDNPEGRRVDARSMFEAQTFPCGSGTFKYEGLDVIADWHGVSLAEFASNALSGRVGRLVIDRTGLAGLFDIHLEFSSDALNARAFPKPATDLPSPSRPTISGALRSQLGLKLTASRVPISAIIIEKAERPTEN